MRKIAAVVALLALSLTAQRLENWTQFGADTQRSSAPAGTTGVTAANVAALQRHAVNLPGEVDASVIYLHGAQVHGATHNTIFATAIYGKTMAIDADSGTVLWVNTPPSFSELAGTAQVTNTTPIADPDRQAIYTMTPDGKVEKLAVSDGHTLWSTAITLLPRREKMDSPLNLYQGHLVAVTAGYIGDRPPYQGHVAILDAGSGKLEHVWNSLCSDRSALIEPSSCPESDSAIWGRSGAVVDPASGDIFVATGNARWDGKTYWGDALIELDPEATRMLGNYTPSNTDQLNDEDLDIGSTSPALLGGDLIAQGGKDGHIYLLSRKAIAGTEPHKDHEVQIVATPSGTDLFTALAVSHSGGGTWVFAADNGGTQAWKLVAGKLVSAWKNSTGGTSPVVAGGLLFVYAPGGGLHVYQPESGEQVAMLACGPGHWNSPIVVDGKIILPQGSYRRHPSTGVLDIWSAH
ncbi:MAG TPA: PQQ-binding-like beta-propeller repeat protein [Terriglobales bacterium]|nr:PQQ-binding-like beta-propeller repeat protein [Terriglobales bacterium]